MEQLEDFSSSLMGSLTVIYFLTIQIIVRGELSIFHGVESEGDFNSTSNDHFPGMHKISDTSGNEVAGEPVLYRVTAGGKNIPVLKMESLNNSYAGGKNDFLSVNEISDLNENNDTGIIEEVSFIVNGVVRKHRLMPRTFFHILPTRTVFMRYTP